MGFSSLSMLKGCGLLFLLLALSRCTQTKKTVDQEVNKPNIVFILADQFRAQATGYGGDPNAKTPNLDRLAAQKDTGAADSPA